MSDDLTTGGIVPAGDLSSDVTDFDPNALESDDLLDDFVEEDLLKDDLLLGDDEDDDPLFPSEGE